MEYTYTKQEALVKIREYHNAIKVHPYWMTFDNKQLREVYELFMQMQHYFFGSELSTRIYEDNERYFEYYSTPQSPIIMSITHDFNRDLGKILCGEHISSYIAQIQSYLSLFHSLVDDSKTAIGIVQYKSKKDNKVKMNFIHSKKDEHGYRLLYEIRDKEQLETYIKAYRRLLEKYPDDKQLKLWLKDIEENTGIYFVIK